MPRSSMPCAPFSLRKQGEYEVRVWGRLDSGRIWSMNLPIMECSEVPMRYRSSPSILYIMASISAKDMTPVTTLPRIMKGGCSR